MKSRERRIFVSITANLKEFYREKLFHPAPLLIALLFMGAKVWGNVSYGGSFVTGLRSGVMGLIMYVFALGVITILSKPSGEAEVAKIEPAKLRGALISVGACYVLTLLRIIDNLQRGSYLLGTPLLNIVPGYAKLYTFLTTVPGGYRVSNILWGLPLYIILPWVLLHALGIQRDSLLRSSKNIRPAIPFLLLYATAFVATGLNLERLWFLVYAFLYAGVQEEFFFRGVMQPLLIARFRNSIWGIIISALIFALLHIPDFVFRVYPSVPLALSSVASVALFGILMGYGVHRTGLVWPWMIIHALSNVLGW